MPTTASTCCEMRYSAHEWAALASYFESHQTYLTWRPLMPPAALMPCMYARTVSRSTEESTGPLMSKKPPIVMVPPPTPDWACELDPAPPDVVGPLFWAVAPDTSPDGLTPPKPPC